MTDQGHGPEPAAVADLLATGYRRLLREGRTATPYLDALLLLACTLQLSREAVLAASSSFQVPESAAAAFRELLSRRIDGWPIAYLTGRKEFFGRDFLVDPRVLIPRPDTEILVEAALNRLSSEKLAGDFSQRRVLDLCSGSGCIGITLKAEFPELDVSLGDISAGALEVSTLNSVRLLGMALPSYRSDLFDAIPGTFSLIVSNPPYLTDEECTDPQVLRRGEPAVALAAGTDGLALYRRLVPQGFDKLAEKGYLMVECGAGQAESVSALMEEVGFSGIEILHDLSGQHRAVTGTRIS